MEKVIDTDSGRRGPTEDWVSAFRECWASPKERLEPMLRLLSPDVVLKATTSPPMSRGRDAARSAFKRVFRALPDLRADVVDWATHDDRLFIEMTFRTRIGAADVAIPNVDRFRFENGVAVERVAHFDSGVMRRAVLRSPKALLQQIRLRLGV